jgi:hypothetical protein
MLKRVVAIVLCMMLTGCFSYTLRSSTAGDGVVHQGRGSALFWGLRGVQRHAHECPEGMAYARTYQPWWSFIVATLTIGIVTPWRSQYECAREASPPATPARPASRPHR